MSFETDLLISQVQTLRYLPPKTYLETDQAEDEQLLNELLSINPDLDPVQWLMETHAGYCVKLLFWKILDGLRGNLLGLQRTLAAAAFVVNKNELEAGLGYRFNAQDLATLKPLTYIHPLQADVKTLLSIFWGLKRELVPLAAGRFEKPSLELRTELLSLPRQVNPLKWLRENHLQYAAESTLRYLMRQVFPDSNRSALNQLPPESHYPKVQPIQCRAGDIVFSLSRLVPIFDIMAIEISFTVKKRHTRGLDAKPTGFARWDGIPSLSDDLGDRYLISRGGGEMGVSFPMKWKWLFACYPRISEAAKTFTFSYDTVSLTVEERESRKGLPHPDHDIRRCYDIPVENLEWTVDIAALRRQFPGFY